MEQSGYSPPLWALDTRIEVEQRTIGDWHEGRCWVDLLIFKFSCHVYLHVTAELENQQLEQVPKFPTTPRTTNDERRPSLHHITNTTAPHCTWEDRSEGAGNGNGPSCPDPTGTFFLGYILILSTNINTEFCRWRTKKPPSVVFSSASTRTHPNQVCSLFGPLLHMPSMQTYPI